MKKTFLITLLLAVGSITFTSCTEQPLPEPEIVDIEATGDDPDGDDFPPEAPGKN